MVLEGNKLCKLYSVDIAEGGRTSSERMKLSSRVLGDDYGCHCYFSVKMTPCSSRYKLARVLYIVLPMKPHHFHQFLVFGVTLFDFRIPIFSSIIII